MSAWTGGSGKHGSGDKDTGSGELYIKNIWWASCVTICIGNTQLGQPDSTYVGAMYRVATAGGTTCDVS